MSQNVLVYSLWFLDLLLPLPPRRRLENSICFARRPVFPLSSCREPLQVRELVLQGCSQEPILAGGLSQVAISCWALRMWQAQVSRRGTEFSGLGNVSAEKPQYPLAQKSQVGVGWHPPLAPPPPPRAPPPRLSPCGQPHLEPRAQRLLRIAWGSLQGRQAGHPLWRKNALVWLSRVHWKESVTGW